MRVIDIHMFQMLEDNVLKAAAPECRFGLGWVYHKGFCYLFTSYHIDFLKAEELCNEQARSLNNYVLHSALRFTCVF